MSKRWNRPETWIALVVGAIGLLLAAIMGLHAYMSITATSLHPDSQRLPSVTRETPALRWADAVRRGQELLRAAITSQNLPGLSVAVGIDGEIVWAEGFGWEDLETETPVTPDTRFRIGTASIVLTSAAAGVLIEKGRLDLDDRIQLYVPAFPEKQWPVTVRQLMAHTGGIRNDAGDEEPLASHCAGTGDRLDRFAGRGLLFEPGTQYHFSSYGWILVGEAVAAAAHEPFLTFMRQQVFEPLGMGRTTADQTTEFATSYFPRYAAEPRYGPDPARAMDPSCFAGASGFLSTASDLVRFGLAIQAGRLLQPATVETLQTSQRLPSGEETGYGLGWDLETVDFMGEQTRVVGHDGTVMGGMVSSLITLPGRGIVVAALSNTSYADTFQLGVSVAEAFAGRRSGPASQ